MSLTIDQITTTTEAACDCLFLVSSLEQDLFEEWYLLHPGDLGSIPESTVESSLLRFFRPLARAGEELHGYFENHAIRAIFQQTHREMIECFGDSFGCYHEAVLNRVWRATGCLWPNEPSLSDGNFKYLGALARTTCEGWGAWEYLDTVYQEIKEMEFPELEVWTPRLQFECSQAQALLGSHSTNAPQVNEVHEKIKRGEVHLDDIEQAIYEELSVPDIHYTGTKLTDRLIKILPNDDVTWDKIKHRLNRLKTLGAVENRPRYGYYRTDKQLPPMS